MVILALVALSVERWTGDWQVIGSNIGLEGKLTCDTISFVSVQLTRVMVAQLVERWTSQRLESVTRCLE